MEHLRANGFRALKLLCQKELSKAFPVIRNALPFDAADDAAALSALLLAGDADGAAWLAQKAGLRARVDDVVAGADSTDFVRKVLPFADAPGEVFHHLCVANKLREARAACPPDVDIDTLRAALNNSAFQVAKWLIDQFTFPRDKIDAVLRELQGPARTFLARHLFIPQGWLVAIEGVDKSTQAHLLASRINGVVISGGPPVPPDPPFEVAYLERLKERWARVEHIESALRAGKHVVLDGYTDSDAALLSKKQRFWACMMHLGLPVPTVTFYLVHHETDTLDEQIVSTANPQETHNALRTRLFELMSHE